ncbi:MAG: LptF/LptG family permease, partial [Candidatus Krumholzibacteria bacterium]|nr:LptF/LptG family permease [Candidatus Krumholzibacteria bacterium]
SLGQETVPTTVGKLVFRNVGARRDWVFTEFSRGGPQTGVLIKQFADGGRLEWELTADRAHYENGSWRFDNGTLVRYEYRDGDALGTAAEFPFETRVMPEVDEAPSDIIIDLRPAEQLAVADMCRLLRGHVNLPRATRRVFATTIWQRRAAPLACLVAVLLAVGLVAAAEEAHVLRGFAGAVGGMIGYYFVSHAFVLFGKSGWLPAVVAGLAPTAAFLVWAMYRVYRCR